MMVEVEARRSTPILFDLTEDKEEEEDGVELLKVCYPKEPPPPIVIDDDDNETPSESGNDSQHQHQKSQSDDSLRESKGKEEYVSDEEERWQDVSESWSSSSSSSSSYSSGYGSSNSSHSVSQEEPTNSTKTVIEIDDDSDVEVVRVVYNQSLSSESEESGEEEDETSSPTREKRRRRKQEQRNRKKLKKASLSIDNQPERATESKKNTYLTNDGDVCPICLGEYEDPTITDGCKHIFCFICILQWSSVNPKCLCPLCKSQFHSLLHNIKSEKDFERYHIEVVEDTPPTRATIPTARDWRDQVRNHYAQYQNYQPQPQREYSSYHGRNYRQTSRQTNWDWGAPSPSNSVSSYQRGMDLSERHITRRRVYTSKQTPILTRLLPETRKTITAHLIKNDWRRIEKFVIRELQALTEYEDVAFLVSFLKSVLENYPPNTTSAIKTVESSMKDFVFEYAKQFVQELKIFIESGLDLIAYDALIVYH